MNYSNYSKKPEVVDDIPDTCIHVQANVIATEPEVENEQLDSTPETTNEVFGVVTGCSKLNIREEPSTDSEVLAVVSSGTTLEIDMDDFGYDWLAVCTASGISGYCMAQYVDIKD